MAIIHELATSLTPVVRGNSVALEFPAMPRLVFGGSEELVLRAQFVARLPQPLLVDSCRVFMATERGDIGEFDIEMESLTDWLLRASYHKEVPASYSAWQSYHCPLGVAPSRKFNINLLARVTGPNTLLTDEEINRGREGHRLSAVVHYSLILDGQWI